MAKDPWEIAEESLPEAAPVEVTRRRRVDRPHVDIPLWLRRTMGAVALAFALLIWLPTVPRLFGRDAIGFAARGGLCPRGRGLMAHQMSVWQSATRRDREVARVQQQSVEGNLTARADLCLALANAVWRGEDTERALATIDTVIEDTLDLESQFAMDYFLSPTADLDSFEIMPRDPLSQFIESNVCIMLASRCVLDNEDKAGQQYQIRLRLRVEEMARRMERTPTLSAETYAGRARALDNLRMLVAMRMYSHVTGGTEFDDLTERWLDMAAEKLIDSDTGLLVESYTLDGTVLEGPRGAVSWRACHYLDLFDPGFARSQYGAAEAALAGRMLPMFVYGQEWPPGGRGAADSRSGPAIPLIGATSASTIDALLAAATVGETFVIRGLLRSIDLMGFPASSGDGMTYLAGNLALDARLFLAAAQGPAWQRIRNRKAESGEEE